VTESPGNGTSFSRRNNNSIQYWSPVFNGVQFRLGTALANYQSANSSPVNAAAGVQKPKYYSANVTYARGPLALAAGYETHEGFRPTTAATSVANPKDKAYQIGGKWDFGLGQVGVGYEVLDYAQADTDPTVTTSQAIKVPSYVVDGRVNAGPGAVWDTLSGTRGRKNCASTKTVE